MESNDFEEDFKFEDDAMSESSGDSILIGVEDQTEFNDYTEKMKEIDVDMDLYSKLQGNRQATSIHCKSGWMVSCSITGTKLWMSTKGQRKAFQAPLEDETHSTMMRTMHKSGCKFGLGETSIST